MAGLETTGATATRPEAGETLAVVLGIGTAIEVSTAEQRRCLAPTHRMGATAAGLTGLGVGQGAEGATGATDSPATALARRGHSGGRASRPRPSLRRGVGRMA